MLAELLYSAYVFFNFEKNCVLPADKNAHTTCTGSKFALQQACRFDCNPGYEYHTYGNKKTYTSTCVSVNQVDKYMFCKSIENSGVVISRAIDHHVVSTFHSSAGCKLPYDSNAISKCMGNTFKEGQTCEFECKKGYSYGAKLKKYTTKCVDGRATVSMFCSSQWWCALPIEVNGNDENNCNQPGTFQHHVGPCNISTKDGEKTLIVDGVLTNIVNFTCDATKEFGDAIPSNVKYVECSVPFESPVDDIIFTSSGNCRLDEKNENILVWGSCWVETDFIGMRSSYIFEDPNKRLNGHYLSCAGNYKNPEVVRVIIDRCPEHNIQNARVTEKGCFTGSKSKKAHCVVECDTGYVTHYGASTYKMQCSNSKLTTVFECLLDANDHQKHDSVSDGDQKHDSVSDGNPKHDSDSYGDMHQH